jgi:nucleoside-diphosphate-sugar epimerase
MDNKSRVLVFGGNGWIGSKVINILTDMNIKFYKSKCRADDIKSVESEIEEIGNITHIMSFIGRTDVPYLNCFCHVIVVVH